MIDSTPPPLPQAPNRPTGHTPCPACHGPIEIGAQKCRHCSEDFRSRSQSNTTAGCLGLLFGPVGLWYKGLWAAGFVWLAFFLLFILITGGVGIVLAPLFWIGMSIHAIKAKPKGSPNYSSPASIRPPAQQIASETAKPATPNSRSKKSVLLPLIAVVSVVTILGLFISAVKSSGNGELQSKTTLSEAPATAKKEEHKPAEAQRSSDQIFRENIALIDLGIKGFREAKPPTRMKDFNTLLSSHSFTVGLIEANATKVNTHNKAALKKRINAMSEAQIKQFPRLRDSFGPAARKKLWENDISVKTVGSGYRTAKFTGHIFAANKGIKIMQEMLRERFMELRFTRVEYKWHTEADKLQYFDLKPPKDSEVIYYERGQWTKIAL